MRKVLAISFAFLILFTNIGLTFSSHYCGETLVESAISFGHHELSCGMKEMDKPCEKNSHETSFKSKSCCENKYVQLQAEDEQNIQKIDKIESNYTFIIPIVLFYLNSYIFENLQQKEYLNYSPPLLRQNIPVLIQSFLI